MGIDKAKMYRVSTLQTLMLGYSQMEQGYPVDTEARFSEAVENHFDELSSIRKAGGRIFVAV